MNKASGGDGTPIELFLILKDDAVKELHSICQHIWKIQQWPRDWKSQFALQSQRRAMTKSVQTTVQLHSFHTLTRSCSKFFKLGFNSIWMYYSYTMYIPDVQTGFRKGRRTGDQIANLHWIIEKARESQKHIYFCFIDYAKAFYCGSQQTVENSSRDGNTRPPDLPPEKSVCRSRSKRTGHGTTN